MKKIIFVSVFLAISFLFSGAAFSYTVDGEWRLTNNDGGWGLLTFSSTEINPGPPPNGTFSSMMEEWHFPPGTWDDYGPPDPPLPWGSGTYTGDAYSYSGPLSQVLFSDGTPVYFYNMSNITFDLTSATTFSGSYDIQLTDLTGNPVGAPILDYEFEGTMVPVPGAVWLLGSGLMGLVGIRRRYVKK